MEPITIENLPLVLTVNEMASVLRVGKTVAYQLVSSGAIKSIRVRHAIRIPRKALLEYVDQTGTL